MANKIKVKIIEHRIVKNGGREEGGKRQKKEERREDVCLQKMAVSRAEERAQQVEELTDLAENLLVLVTMACNFSLLCRSERS